jgi:hypothetical protein
MPIDHFSFAAPGLEAGVREIEEGFGVGAVGGGQHLGQGTHNRMLALGSTMYLEIGPDVGPGRSGVWAALKFSSIPAVAASVVRLKFVM